MYYCSYILFYAIFLFVIVAECNNIQYKDDSKKVGKYEASTNMLHRILKKVIEDNNDIIQKKGLRIDIKIKTYKTKVIKMFDEYDSFYERYEEASKNTDIGAVIEFQEMQKILLIPALLNAHKIKYMIV